MILDADGKPIEQPSQGWQYAQAILRSRRDTKHNLASALHSGWTVEQFRHWVNTGEAPVSAGEVDGAVGPGEVE